MSHCPDSFTGSPSIVTTARKSFLSNVSGISNKNRFLTVFVPSYKSPCSISIVTRFFSIWYFWAFSLVIVISGFFPSTFGIARITAFLSDFPPKEAFTQTAPFLFAVSTPFSSICAASVSLPVTKSTTVHVTCAFSDPVTVNV